MSKLKVGKLHQIHICLRDLIDISDVWYTSACKGMIEEVLYHLGILAKVKTSDPVSTNNKSYFVVKVTVCVKDKIIAHPVCLGLGKFITASDLRDLLEDCIDSYYE